MDANSPGRTWRKENKPLHSAAQKRNAEQRGLSEQAKEYSPVRLEKQLTLVINLFY
jgi:hypothetical protein